MIRFCIVTVTYNAEDCLERTIRSVVGQTYPHVDYVLVDGGSKDGTLSIIERYSSSLTRWISEPDKGIYDGMNKGIAIASRLVEADGQERFVLMLNADDTLYQDTTLAEVASFLEQQPQLPDVFCGAWMIHPEHGRYLQCPGDLTKLPGRFVLNHQATFVKASVLAKNPFELKYKIAGDFRQLSSLYLQGYTFLTSKDIIVSDMIINRGATNDNWKQGVEEGFEVVKQNGCYRRGAKEWLLLRKQVVRLIKRVLPRKASDAFFRWLAVHYKAM